MRKKIKLRISFGIVLLTILAVTNESIVWAQSKTQPQSSEKPLGIPASLTEDISLDQLKAKRVSVEGSTGLDVTNKKNVLNSLDKALQLRELADKVNRQRVDGPGAGSVDMRCKNSAIFGGGIVAHLLKYHKSDLLTRLRFGWYPLAVGLPLFAVVLAALGYYFSSDRALADLGFGVPGVWNPAGRIPLELQQPG